MPKTAKIDAIYTTELYGNVDRWFFTKKEAIERQKYLMKAENNTYDAPESFITEWKYGENHNPQVIG